MTFEEAFEFVKKNREYISRLLGENKYDYYYAYKLADRFNEWNKDRKNDQLKAELITAIEEFKFAPRLGSMQIYINARKYWKEENKGFWSPIKKNEQNT